MIISLRVNRDIATVAKILSRSKMLNLLQSDKKFF